MGQKATGNTDGVSDLGFGKEAGQMQSTGFGGGGWGGLLLSGQVELKIP